MKEVWNKSLLSLPKRAYDSALVAVHPTYGKEMVPQHVFDWYFDNLTGLWQNQSHELRILLSGSHIDWTIISFIAAPDLEVAVFPDAVNSTGVYVETMFVAGSTAKIPQDSHPGCVDLVAQLLTQYGFCNHAVVVPEATLMPTHKTSPISQGFEVGVNLQVVDLK